MATLNFSITIPDAQVTRAQDAIKGYLGDPLMTNASAIEGLRQEFITRIKEIILRRERAAAIVAAEVADYSLDAT